MVGGVLDALDEMGVADNTLVIFTSDNGGMLNVTGQKAWKAGHRLKGNLQGFKFGAWEGGHRVPFIARWPGRIPAGTTSGQLLNLVDLVATMAAITGRELKQGQGLDSINQLESLTNCQIANPINAPLMKPLLALIRMWSSSWWMTWAMATQVVTIPSRKSPRRRLTVWRAKGCASPTRTRRVRFVIPRVTGC